MSDTLEQHLQDTLVAGRWINRPEMVRTMVLDAQKQAENLLSYGVPLQKKENGKLRITSLPGHSVGRNIVTEKSFGTDFTLPLLNFAKDIGVKFLAGVFVAQLCRGEDGNIAGALVIDPNRRGLILIQASATVLACGGAGRIYAQTNNVPGTTGDGYALALQLGLSLIDMEFVQYYPTFLYESSLPGTMVLYEVLVYRGGARLLNSLGENIAIRHGLVDPSLMTRDALTLAIAKEINEGRGINGGVWMDLSTISGDRIQRFEKFIPKGLKGRTKFIVTPVVHFFMGGISVNSHGETAIGGLYSAGEINGGVHGANRLGGNALTEAWVYGDITGRLAAQHAQLYGEPSGIQNLQSIVGKIEACPGGSEQHHVEELRKELQQLMWKKAGIIRTKENLSGLIKNIEGLKNKLAGTKVKNWDEIIYKLETDNMLLVGEAVARSALLREESRGAHYRDDFPGEGGEEWIKSISVVRNSKEDMYLVCNSSRLPGR